MHIVLVEPEIPQNTGNIARTCAATGATLHLVHPLGFSIDEKHVRRAGLDYWSLRCYASVRYPPDAFLVFGKETKGLPEDLLRKNLDRCIRIPMRDGLRSLNLGNSVAVVLYEALRQNGFASLLGQSAYFNH